MTPTFVILAKRNLDAVYVVCGTFIHNPAASIPRPNWKRHQAFASSLATATPDEFVEALIELNAYRSLNEMRAHLPRSPAPEVWYRRPCSDMNCKLLLTRTGERSPFPTR